MQQHCLSCGTARLPGQGVCAACGRIFEEDATAATPAPASAPGRGLPPPPPPPRWDAPPAGGPAYGGPAYGVPSPGSPAHGSPAYGVPGYGSPAAPLSRTMLAVAAWAEALAWVATALVGFAAVVSMTAVSLYGDYWVARSGSAAEDRAWTAYTARTDTAAVGTALGFLVNVALVILLMILWFRVIKHARQAGAETGLGQGWAIGAWFVPCASLVLAPLVGANVRRMAAWRGAPPIGRSWRTSFPVAAAMIIVAFAVTSVINVSSAGYEATDRSSAMAREFLSNLAYVGWAVGLVAAALLTRATRKDLQESPLVDVV